MQEELKTFDAGDLPGLDELARQVQITRKPLRIVENGEELAVLRPAKKPHRASPRGRRTSADDPLWQIIGIGHSEGPNDVSVHKHKYLAEASMPKRP